MNKLMIRHTMDKPLPYDAEVEYLESTGTQYIDTGAIWYGDDYEIQIDFFLTDSTFIGGNVPFGAQDSLTLCALLFQGSPYNGTVLVYGGSGSTDNRAKFDLFNLGRNNITMRLNNNVVTVTINGTVTTYSAQTDCVNVIPTISLFAVHQPDGYKILARMKLYSFRLIKQGSLIRDMKPVRKGNTGYLYDKVSGQLFGNQGTGSFVVGPDYNPFAYQYLTFVPLEDSTFSFAKRGTGNDIEYSIDGGAWTSLASEANTPTVGAGHNIRWRGELTPSTVSNNRGIGTFSASGLYDAMGNTMSLLYGDNYIGQTTLVGIYTFYQLWYYDTHIYRADNLILPATTLTTYCYVQMYYGCTALTTAPALPATKLAVYSNNQMFRNCTNLSFVKCLATDISARSCKDNWLRSVSSQGTFIKAAGMKDWPIGPSGIPSGWTVVDDNS